MEETTNSYEKKKGYNGIISGRNQMKKVDIRI